MNNIDIQFKKKEIQNVSKYLRKKAIFLQNYY